MNELLKMIDTVRSEKNPAVLSSMLGYFISSALRDKQMTLYEAYLINTEIIRLVRRSYKEIAWGRNVMIRNCIALLNQYLMAKIFNDLKCQDTFKAWAIEALKLVSDGRIGKHYLMSRFEECFNNDNVLRDMSKIREQYDSLSDNKGPFHIEVFPAHYFSPEDYLLGNKVDGDFDLKKSICNSGIEELLIELSLID